MAFNLGELKAIVSLDTSSLTSQVGSVGGALSTIGGGFTALAGTVAAVGTAIAAAGVALTTKFVKDGITAGIQMEQTRTAFNTMIGDATLAGQTLAELSKFSRETPFELPEVLTASKQLLAYGFSTDELIPKLKMVGDVAAGLSIPVGDLTYLFGTLKAQGTAYTKDLNQFANRGIPIYDELAKVLGITTDQVRSYAEESKIGYDDVEKAFSNMTGEGGKFFNMMQAQSQTAGGIISNLKDSFYQLTLALVGVDPTGAIKEGGLFDKFKNIAQSLLEVLNQNRDKITDLADKFGGILSENLQKVIDGVTYLVTHWKDLKDQVTQLIQKIDLQTGAFTAMRDEVDQIVDLVKNALIPTIIENKQTFIDIAKVVGVILIVAVEALLIAIKYLVAILTFLIDKIGAAHDWFIKLWKGIQDLPNFFNDLGGAIKSVASLFWQELSIGIQKAIAYFELFYEQGKATLIVMAQQAVGWGADIINGIISGINNAYTNLSTSISNAAENVKNTFKNALGIHSPSTVFKEYGEYAMEGFSQGIESRKTEIQNRLDEINAQLDTWAREDLQDAAAQSKQRKLEIFDLKQERDNLNDQLDLIGQDFEKYQQNMDDFAGSITDIKDHIGETINKFKDKIKEARSSFDDFRNSIKKQRNEENQSYADSNDERKANLAQSIAEEIVALDDKQAELAQSIADEQALGADADAEKLAELQASLDETNAIIAAHAEDRKTYSNEIAELERYNAMDAVEQVKYQYEQEQLLADQAHTEKLETLKKSLQDEEDSTNATLDRIKERREKVMKGIREDFKETTDKIKTYLGEISESTAGVDLFNTITKLGTRLTKLIGNNLSDFGVQKFAEGGIVQGSGGIDSVPALLTPGERVLKPGEEAGRHIVVNVYDNIVQNDSALADLVMERINKEQERNRLFGSI